MHHKPADAARPPARPPYLTSGVYASAEETTEVVCRMSSTSNAVFSADTAADSGQGASSVSAMRQCR